MADEKEEWKLRLSRASNTGAREGIMKSECVGRPGHTPPQNPKRYVVDPKVI